MKFNEKAVELTNELRRKVQRDTKTVDDGESVSILLWWTFIQDHARCQGIEPKALAVHQLKAFLEVSDGIEMVLEH